MDNKKYRPIGVYSGETIYIIVEEKDETKNETGNDYAILTNPNLSVLQEQVILMLGKGYRPCGGVAEITVNHYPGNVYAQAMVRLEDLSQLKQS